MKPTLARTESFKFVMPRRNAPGVGTGGRLSRQSWEIILLVAHCRAEAGRVKWHYLYFRE